MATRDAQPMHVHARIAVLAVVVSVSALVLAGCGDVCNECDPATEYCRVRQGSHFMQNGNTNPLGEPTTSSCQPLPARCLDDVSCPCLTCEARTTDEQVAAGDCMLWGYCSEDVASALRLEIPTE